jgi:hypothetical protein
MGIVFQVIGFGADKDTLLNIQTPGNDSIFYPGETNLSLLLPLNPKTNSLEYIFRWKDGSIDTLIIGYTAQVQFVSAECAQRYVFGNLTPLFSTFDSVRVFNPAPTAPPSTSLVIYRCAKPDLAGVKFRTRKGASSADSVLLVTSVTADFPFQDNVERMGPSFYLPLNSTADTTNFEFAITDGSMEKLQIAYTRTTRQSPIQDCGLVTFFTRVRITATSFDTTSTKVIKPAGYVLGGSNTRDPAIINFEIFL